ncbi:MAG: tetratricopeptide repeat protein [Candidatus Krumholzibacteriota bacterium]|nr:tetratricopeptide repeat protein [Candidatus Krumholzibacteriota bacterium]
MFIDRFIGLLPKNKLKKALSHMNQGEYRKACREFESYVAKNTDEVRAQDQEMVRMYMVESYIECAKLLDEEGRLADAAKELEKAIELEPKYADVHYNLGTLYERIGNRVNARECIKRSLAINPNYFKARLMLAKSYWSDENKDRALEELEICLSAAPNFYLDPVNELISLVRRGGMEKEAAALFHRLLEERPSSSQVSKQLALESIQNGDYDYAMAELKKSLSLHPDYPDLHNLLGITYANKGMTDDAILQFKTALKVNPNYLKARLNLALALYEKRSLEEASQNLEIILKHDPRNELANNLLREVKPVMDKR